MNPIAILRTIDDANLDPYQHKMLTHIWRVGICWKGFERLAEDTNMSVGKAYETRKWLVDNGWIVKCRAESGKKAFKLNESKIEELNALPIEQVAEFSPHENFKEQEGIPAPEFSQDENEFSPHETKINNIKNKKGDINELREIFSQATGYFPPSDPETREFSWDRPLREIYKRAGKDFEKYQKAIGEGVKVIRKKNYTLSSPKSIQVSSINYLNGVKAKGTNGHYGQYWKQVEKELTTNGRRSTKSWNGQIAPALKKLGGYKQLCGMNIHDAERAFETAFNDLERTPA